MATTEVNFLDLAALLKVGDDTAFEKFSSVLNSSIFDASNIAGTLKQKGLIDFTSYYPGPNKIILTDVGRALIAEANGRSGEQLDKLDDSILHQLSGGKRMPAELQDTLNVRPKDLALRLYKLLKQNLITFEFKNGNVELILTEHGFLQAKSEQQPVQPKPGKQGEPAAPQEQQTQTAPAAPMTPEQVHATIKNLKAEEKAKIDGGAHQADAKGRKGINIKLVIIAVVVVILIVLILAKQGYITLPFALP